jgi:HPt (histidine-containing phosphotransfer) domain-containing protein
LAKRDLTGAVDFAHLERFTAGDAALIEEVLGIFREQAGMWLRLLDAGAPAQAWKDAAHTLKGSALGVGAFELAEACAAAEAERDGEFGRREVLVGRIRDAADRALTDIAAYLHEQQLRGLRSA